MPTPAPIASQEDLPVHDGTELPEAAAEPESAPEPAPAGEELPVASTPATPPSPVVSQAGSSDPPSVPESAYRRFRWTDYWVAPLEADPTGVEIHDTTGASLGRISAKSKAALDLEGTGRLPDGRIINVSGRKGRYRVLPKGQWGAGVKGRALYPFRSIAVDHGTGGGKKPWKDELTRRGPLVPVGTRVFIRELRGRKLPDGSVHDGWVTADDGGPAIYGAHFDLFIGDKKDRPSHPAEAHIWFEGIDEIPADYAYGLVRVKDYVALRPPGQGGSDNA